MMKAKQNGFNSIYQAFIPDRLSHQVHDTKTDERHEAAKSSNVPAEKGEWVNEVMREVIGSFCLFFSKTS